MTINRSLVAVVALIATIATSAIGAIAATAGASQEHGRTASSFELTFDGRHEFDPEESAVWELPFIDHVGHFTASGAFCSSGSITTTTGYADDWGATRVLTCADGSGSATAVVWSSGEDGEHSGEGNWRLIAGTGLYAKLRGQGTFASSRTGGDWFDHGSITFQSRWAGVADLDDAPPALAISSATASKLRRPAGAYSVKVALALSDDVEGNPVSYTLRVATHPSTRTPGWTPDGFELAKKSGTADAGTVSMTLVVQPNRRARSIRLHLAASDPVGNERSLSQAVKLPR